MNTTSSNREGDWQGGEVTGSGKFTPIICRDSFMPVEDVRRMTTGSTRCVCCGRLIHEATRFYQTSPAPGGSSGPYCKRCFQPHLAADVIEETLKQISR